MEGEVHAADTRGDVCSFLWKKGWVRVRGRVYSGWVDLLYGEQEKEAVTGRNAFRSLLV